MRSSIAIICAVVIALVFIDLAPKSHAAANNTPSVAPEFTHHQPAEWLNSPPLKLTDQKGKVILVEFWAFDCVNCRRTVAWLHSVQEKYAAQNFTIVAVHTPELAQERSTDNVLKAITQQHITYPVMLDADYSYWNALNNQYWPALYLIDAQGRVVAHAIGEMHVGESSARELEQRIDQALAQKQ